MDIETLPVVWLCVLLPRLPVAVPEIREYCFPNAFNVTCGPDAVIVLRSARYGRMNRGKCLTSDYKTDCFADVLVQVDRKCSGRRHCFISIPDNMLHQLQPCPKDLLAYLETDYVCQKVEWRSSSCRYYGDLKVDGGGSGYLSNLVTEELGLGSVRCPWVVRVSRGQRINLTLFDFGVAYRFDDVGNMCHVYAKISEAPMTLKTTSGMTSDRMTSETTSEMTVCGSGTRERSVFISDTNRLEVSIMNLKLDDESVYFLLKYEAIGCVDPWVPRGAWMKRAGEKAVISCNYTSQTWHIVCQGSSWYGKVDNCSSVTLTAKQSTLPSGSRERFAYGLPVAVATGLVIGVLLGVAMLAVVVACFKKLVTPQQTTHNGEKFPSTEARGLFVGGGEAQSGSGPLPPTAVCRLGIEDKTNSANRSNSISAYDYNHLFEKRITQPPVSVTTASNANYDVTDTAGHEFTANDRRSSGLTMECRVDWRCPFDRQQTHCCRHEIEALPSDPDAASDWQGDSV